MRTIETIYQVIGDESVAFENYDKLIHWLWIHVDRYQLTKITIDYTDHRPSKKRLRYHVRSII